MGEGRGEGKTTAPLSDNRSAITDNRLKTYNGTTYYYDDLGNLIHRELADGEVQNYFYDLHDQLVKAEIFKKDGSKETWAYSYDALGRRIGKGRLKNEEVSETSFPHDLSGDLENQTRFVWDGSHLLQEVHSDGRYTYIYTDPSSYEPLAQVRNWTTAEGENRQQTHYFHCDQIGIPREMTDKDGNLLWFGNYTGWGRLKEETKVTDSAYQPFRLQNQYADRETGLHYNFFRYYEPDAGRFVNQDPIGLEGGENLYKFAPNAQNWVDIFGLWSFGDPLPQWLVDGAAGFGDNISMGITKKARQLFGISGGVTESTAYKTGDWLGEIPGLINPAKKVNAAYKGLKRAKLWKCEMKKISRTAKRTRAKRVTKAKANLRSVLWQETKGFITEKIKSKIVENIVNQI